MPVFSRFLRYFVVVGRLGSIRKAAEELNVSASAIDRQILNAEAEIGVPLFERLPSGLRLTAAGEIMMAAGGRWRKGLGEVLAQIEDLRGLKRGHVEIAVIDALATGYLPAAIASIKRRYPEISIGIRVADNDRVHQAVLRGDVDFGIFFEPQSYRDLTVRTFTEVVLGFLTPVAHPLAARGETRFSACAAAAVLMPAEPLAVHQQIAVLSGATGVSPAEAVTCDSIRMIVALVLEGVGIGLVTSLDVITGARDDRLAFTRISDPMLRPMTLALCTASTRALSYAAGMCLQEIENGFAQLGYAAP